MNFWQKPAETLQELLQRKAPHLRQIRHFYSEQLQREVDLDVYLPCDYHLSLKKYPLLIFNDGQDLPRMLFARILERMYYNQEIKGIIVVGIYANHDRHREYGTARQPDYKGRGDRAPQHRDFILQELLPMLRRRFRIKKKRARTAIAGFSLGGLSAFDIAWGNPEVFGAAGVFSGALWWRWSPVDDNNPDADRIMHDIVHNSAHERPAPQRFWFQCGTRDETDDRNRNGIIDSIDDTWDLIKAIRHRGVSEAQSQYCEIQDGTHDPETWGVAMPAFLRWLFVTMNDECF